MAAATETRTPEPVKLPRRTSAWARLSRNGLAVAGLVIVVVIVAIALAAPILPLADPNVTEPANRLLPPFSEGAWLGTDQLGRDMLSRLVWGARVSIAVGVAATLVAALIGSTIGLVAAYFGRITDNVLMRGVDMLMAFPYLLLALAIVAALGPGLMNALLAIAVVNIPFFARSVRGATLGLVNREFIEAARLSGFSDRRIILSELLPNVLPVIVITMSTTVGWMILETAGLSFLGLGAQPPQADLGSMLGDGRNLVINAPHVSIVPGVLILVLVIGINLLGDGLRDVLDPRLKSGALSRPVARTEVAKGPPSGSGDKGALLEVRGLETEFRVGKRVLKAVNGVDFTLQPGESLGIVGESGSGKSVTALSILGLVPTPPGIIAKGAIRFQGTDLLRLPLENLQDIRGNRIAYIFQDPLTTLNPLLRVGDQVEETLIRHQGLRPRAAMAQAVELLDAVGIPDPRQKAPRLPARALGRAAPARRHRHGARQPPGPDHRRRADHGPGRHHPGQGLGPPERSAPPDRGGPDLHHPRPGRRLGALRAGARHVCRPRRRERPGGRGVRGPAPPLYRSTAQLRAGAGPARALARRDPRPAACRRRPAKGCAFADRCTLAVPDCRSREILLARSGEGRRSRCLRWSEVEAAPRHG